MKNHVFIHLPIAWYFCRASKRIDHALLSSAFMSFVEDLSKDSRDNTICSSSLGLDSIGHWDSSRVLMSGNNICNLIASETWQSDLSNEDDNAMA